MCSFNRETEINILNLALNARRSARKGKEVCASLMVRTHTKAVINWGSISSCVANEDTERHQNIILPNTSYMEFQSTRFIVNIDDLM